MSLCRMAWLAKANQIFPLLVGGPLAAWVENDVSHPSVSDDPITPSAAPQWWPNWSSMSSHKGLKPCSSPFGVRRRYRISAQNSAAGIIVPREMCGMACQISRVPFPHSDSSVAWFAGHIEAWRRVKHAYSTAADPGGR